MCVTDFSPDVPGRDMSAWEDLPQRLSEAAHQDAEPARLREAKVSGKVNNVWVETREKSKQGLTHRVNCVTGRSVGNGPGQWLRARVTNNWVPEASRLCIWCRHGGSKVHGVLGGTHDALHCPCFK